MAQTWAWGSDRRYERVTLSGGATYVQRKKKVKRMVLVITEV